MIRPTRMFTSVVICLFAVSIIAGCGGGEDASTSTKPTPSGSDSKNESSGSDNKESESTEPESTEPESTEPETTEKESAPEVTTESSSAGTGPGSFVGTIKFTGTAPTLDPLVAKGDPKAKDAEVCAANGVPNESFVIGERNGVANVFIYMRKAPKDAPEVEVSKEEIEFDQQGCKFVPHAMVLHTSQKVKAVSSDGVAHNLHTNPIKNNAVNQIIPANDKTGLMLEYPEAEIVPVKITCDIHPWMSAWQFPLDHTYAAVTDAAGNFKIENLPPGTHEFRIWHENVGYLEKAYEVTIKAGESEEKTLEYSVEKFTAE